MCSNSERPWTRSTCIVLPLLLFVLPACDDPASDEKGDAVYSAVVNDPDRVLEGTDLVFTINRSVDLSKASTVAYEFSGDATFGEDYEDPNDRKVTFASGQASAEIRLETLLDQDTEEQESVVLTLVSASDGNKDSNSTEATGFIRDAGSSCIGPEGTTVFIDFDDITGEHGPTAGDATRLSDGYYGFIWGDWWARDDIMRPQDEGQEPGRGWFDGIVSKPNAIYPNFGAQPGFVSVITRSGPFMLKSFYLSALSKDGLPVTLRFRDRSGSIVSEETYSVSRGEKAFIEPDMDSIAGHCIYTITFNQPVLGSSFIIDDMTLVY